MPARHIEMFEGRTTDQRCDTFRAQRNTVVEVVEDALVSASVMIIDIVKSDWR